MAIRGTQRYSLVKHLAIALRYIFCRINSTGSIAFSIFGIPAPSTKMISYYKNLLLLHILFFSCCFCYSQNSYHAVWYSSDSNHLPQNSVKSIVPDKYGFIWLATENGIVRFDGLNFKAYNMENTKGTNSNRMLLFDGKIKKDSIIILNEKDECLLIHKRGIKSIPNSIRPEKDLKKINHRSYLLYPGFRYSNINKPFPITAGNTTYIFGQDSVRMYDQNLTFKKKIQYTYKDSTQFFVSAGHLFKLGNNNDYIKFPEKNTAFKKFDRSFSKKSRIFNNIPAQQSFIFSNNQLFYIQHINGILTTRSIYKGFDFVANNIISLYYDEKNEVLFLGSTNKGLLVVKPKDFKKNETDYYHNAGTDDVYYALTEYSKTGILASTGEIFNTNNSTGLIPIGTNSDKYTIIVDHKGDVWTKTDEEIYRYHKKTNYKTSDTWVMENSLSTLSKGLDGSIWISTFKETGNKGGYLYKINPKDTFPAPKLIMSLPFAISEITETKAGFLWVGSWKGLYKIFPATKKYQNIAGVPNAHVRSIYSPEPNEAWICTYGNGFYLFKNGKTTTLPLDRSQHLLTPHCVIEDKSGLLWITTNKGLFAISKQDLLDYTYGKLDKVYYHLLNKNAGFTNNEFNGGCKPCGVFLQNKTIFFPSMDGVVYFSPDKVKKRLPVNNIYIDEIVIDGKIQPETDTLVFKHRFGRIKFYISSPYYGNPYNQNIEAMLDGPISQAWAPLTENNISFSTLPPGNYTLKTRKLGGFGSKWIYKDLKFSIRRAFWQTGWFKLLLLGLLLTILYIIYLLRIRYIKHKNILLEKQVLIKTEQLQNTIQALRKTKDDLSKQVTNHKKLIKTITHDIKSPLRFLAITGRYIYNNTEKKDNPLKDDIKAIHTSASQLYNFVDSFLEYAKETDIESYRSEPYLLHELIAEKTAFFRNLADAAKIIVLNEVEEKLIISVNRHLLSIIIHNLLDNAIKNTFNGVISITAVTTVNTLSIAVKDNGKGMPPALIKYYENLAITEQTGSFTQKSMGLSMIVELLAIMDGSLTINSLEHLGTTVTISFIQKA